MYVETAESGNSNHCRSGSRRYEMENNRIAEIAKQIFSEYLKENKCRRTPERFAVLEAIYSLDDSFEIKELMNHLEEQKRFRVSRATI